MALYFYFNETTGDLVYSDKATYSGEGYTSLGEQTNMNPTKSSNWVFDSQRANIITVTKDVAIAEKITGLTSMNSMFYNCSSITDFDLSGFDTSQATSMGSMFSGCGNLTRLDLSGFDTSQVTNMGNMFARCSGLVSLDLFGFNTSQVTNMGNMFYNCSGLVSLDLSGFDTSQVTHMGSMFYNCSNLVSLDLSGFDTSQAEYKGGEFDGCSSIRLIAISGNMSNILSNLPDNQYYPAAGGEPVAKVSLTAGTWVRDQEDFELLTNIVQQAQMAQSINHRINKLNKKVNGISSGSLSGSNVDIVKVTEHQTSYTKDTLEVVVDSTGAVTAMYFITAE